MNLPTNDIRTDNKEPEKLTGVGRRRFIHGIGIAAPIILTVKSPSALAAQCVAPSAAASMDLLKSRLDRQQLSCIGRTPGFWQNASTTHPLDWEKAGGKGVLFSNVFLSGFSGKTLKQVMNLGGNEDASQLGAHLSAAYLNLKRGWVPETVLSLSQLREMWGGRLGSYEPTAGVKWGGELIVTYLKTTMPL